MRPDENLGSRLLPLQERVLDQIEAVLIGGITGADGSLDLKRVRAVVAVTEALLALEPSDENL